MIMKDNPPDDPQIVPGTTPIPLKNITVHPCNRSHGSTYDSNYIMKLQVSIKDGTPIHPLLLTPSIGNPDQYLVVVGANRLEAIRRTRGENGQLFPDDYRLVTDATMEQLTRLSCEENLVRTGRPVGVDAVYAARLMDELEMTRAQVGKLLGIRPQMVTAYLQLERREEHLPESWHRDLFELHDGSREKPVITASHWEEVHSKLPEGELPDNVVQLLERARSRKLSARETGTMIRKALSDEPTYDEREQMGLAELYDEERIPDYGAVIKHISLAWGAAGGDEELVNLLRAARCYVVPRREWLRKEGRLPPSMTNGNDCQSSEEQESDGVNA